MEKPIPTISFNNGNVLQPTISFNTTRMGQVYIEYWLHSDSLTLKRSKISDGNNHSFTLLNLKPSSKYFYTINDLTSEYKSEKLSFMTSVLPEEVLKTNKILIDTSQFEGYILLRKLGAISADVLVDNEGDVVWYNLYDTIVRRSFTWTERNTILSGYDTARLVEYDIYGNSILDINLKQVGVKNSIHHEVLFNDKDEIVALTFDSVKMDLRKFGGNQDQYIRADGVIRLKNTGEKLWEWNLLDGYDPKQNLNSTFDPKQSLGHANSMTIDKDGHYIISFRDFSQVWKVNSNDGTVIWKLGKGGDFEMPEESYFIAQHSIHFNKFGELMMFDNGEKTKRPNSRVLRFTLDEDSMKAKLVRKVVLPIELSAYKMCSAELVDDDKYLVCTSSKNGIITIVNNQGDILWRVNLSHPSYRAYFIKDPFDNQ